jgi:hypothetical protein
MSEPQDDDRPDDDARVFGEIGNRLLFENDRVRLWEVKLAPGERGDLHRHDLDHVLVHVNGDRVAVASEPDSPTPHGPYLEADIAPGDVSFARRGGIETAINVGRTTFHEIIVELKD